MTAARRSGPRADACFWAIFACNDIIALAGTGDCNRWLRFLLRSYTHPSRPPRCLNRHDITGHSSARGKCSVTATKLVGNCLLGISTAHVTWRSFLVPESTQVCSPNCSLCIVTVVTTGISHCLHLSITGYGGIFITVTTSPAISLLGLDAGLHLDWCSIPIS